MAICSCIAAANFGISLNFKLSSKFLFTKNSDNPDISRIFGEAGLIKKFG